MQSFNDVYQLLKEASSIGNICDNELHISEKPMDQLFPEITDLNKNKRLSQ